MNRAWRLLLRLALYLQNFISSVFLPFAPCSSSQESVCSALGQSLVHATSETGCQERCVSPFEAFSFTCGPCVVEFHDEGELTDAALYLTNYVFGPTLSAHGRSAIWIHQNFVFVSWYSGGMENRYVQVSRKRIGKGSDWQTVSLDHQHQFYRPDWTRPESERRGDSHNIIAIAVSSVDDRIHLLYDMHAYTEPPDYFNYQTTVVGAATRLNFTKDLFLPKQHHLRDDHDFRRITYPTFFLLDNQLHVSWRVGGNIDALIQISSYDRGTWSLPVDFNANMNVGIYGEFSYTEAGLVFCWQQRSQEDQAAGYINNRGLYLAHSNDAGQSWSTTAGITDTAPVLDLSLFKIAEPSQPGESMVGGGGGAILPHVRTPSGAFHAHVRVDGRERHLYQAGPSDQVVVDYDNGEDWSSSVSVFFVAGRIYRVGLQSDRPVIQSTEPGTHQWRDEYRSTEGRIFSHGVAVQSDNAIFYYVQQRKPRAEDARPLRVLRFTIKV